MRVQVTAQPMIVKALHNKTGNVIDTKEVNPPSGNPYKMYRVKLDEATDVGGSIIMESIYLPDSCFTELPEAAR